MTAAPVSRTPATAPGGGAPAPRPPVVGQLEHLAHLVGVLRGNDDLDGVPDDIHNELRTARTGLTTVVDDLIDPVDEIAHLVEVLAARPAGELAGYQDDIADALEIVEYVAEAAEEIAAAEQRWRATDEGSQRCSVVPLRLSDGEVTS